MFLTGLSRRMQVRPRPPPRIWRKNESAPACSRVSLALFVESIFVQASPQHICKSRTARVVLAVDLFATLSEVMFQVPQIGRQLDLTGPSFLLLESPRESLAPGQRRRLRER